MNLTITGHITPYVRMTQRSKFCNPAAMDYISNQAKIKRQISNQIQGEIYDKTPLRVTGLIFSRKRQGDTDNIIKAILDACQGIVFANDLWVDDIRFIRKYGNEEGASVTVEMIQEV